MSDQPDGEKPLLLQTTIECVAQVDGRLVEFDKVTIVPTDVDQCIAFWKPGQRSNAADLGFRITNKSAQAMYELLGQALNVYPGSPNARSYGELPAKCSTCESTDQVESTYCGSFGRGCGCLAKHCESCEICRKDFGE